MPTNTPNYNLVKPASDEFYDVNVTNENMVKIDLELKMVNDEVDEHKADYVKHPAFASTTGSATAYTVTLTPAPVNVGEGFGITIVPHIANGANLTLNVNGLGAVALKDQKGVAFKAGKLLVGMPYSFRKVGTSFLADSGSGGGGNLQPNQALAGFTFANDDGDQVGLGDADLIPANIRKDLEIFGVIGTLNPERLAKGIVGNLGAGNYTMTVRGMTFRPRIVVITFYFGHRVVYIDPTYWSTGSENGTTNSAIGLNKVHYWWNNGEDKYYATAFSGWNIYADGFGLEIVDNSFLGQVKDYIAIG